MCFNTIAVFFELLSDEVTVLTAEKLINASYMLLFIDGQTTFSYLKLQFGTVITIIMSVYYFDIHS